MFTFITGAGHPPPMGFDNTPQIMFEVAKNRPLPSVSTCGPILYLPLVLQNPDYFRDRMDYAICGALGFGTP